MLTYSLCAAMQMRRDPDAGEMAEARIEVFAAVLTTPALLTALWVLLEASGTVEFRLACRVGAARATARDPPAIVSSP